MDKKEMFSKVGEILKELNEQYQYLSKAPDKMNELEIELFVANSNFLADHIKIVQKLNNTTETIPAKTVEKSQSEPAEKAPELPKTEPAKPVTNELREEKKTTDLPTEESAKSATNDLPEEKAAEAPVEEHKKEDELKFEFEKEEQDNEKEEAESKPADVTPIAGEPVVHEVIIREKTISVDTPAKASTDPAPTLNEVMASQLDQSTVASKYNRQSVGDLKSIISLNDKLLFVKDLFNGYSLAYSEAIELLNRFDSLDSADNFLKTNYSAKNNWSDKQSTVDKFYEILNRRFTK
jgi:hypothetical protein